MGKIPIFILILIMFGVSEVFAATPQSLQLRLFGSTKVSNAGQLATTNQQGFDYKQLSNPTKTLSSGLPTSIKIKGVSIGKLQVKRNAFAVTGRNIIPTNPKQPNFIQKFLSSLFQQKRPLIPLTQQNPKGIFGNTARIANPQQNPANPSLNNPSVQNKVLSTGNIPNSKTIGGKQFSTQTLKSFVASIKAKKQ